MRPIITLTALALAASSASARPCLKPGALAQPIAAPQSVDYLGQNIRISNDVAIASASYDDANAQAAGAAVIYRRAAGIWSVDSVLRLDAAVPYLYFGAAVAIEGNLALVGIPGVFNFLGAVIAYRYDGDSWEIAEGIQRADAQVNTGYGNVIALDGTTAMMGASSTLEGGTVYVFQYNGSTWTEQPAIHPPATGHYYFGSSIALDRDYAAISSPGGDDGGAVHIYHRSGNIWALQQTIANPVPVYEDQFGYRIALSQDRLAISAYNYDTGDARVEVYARSGTDWTLEDTITDPSPGDYESFGGSISLRGDRLLVGCPNEQAGSTCQDPIGAAFLYERRPTEWTLSARIDHPTGACYTGFGGAVALTENDALIGATYDQQSPQQLGSITAVAIDEPDFFEHPESQSVEPGSSISFAAAFFSPTPHTPRWRKNGVLLTDGDGIAGATTAMLTIHDAQLEDFGAYDCILTTYCGDIIASNPAALSVASPPASCTGDADSNGAVNFADITSVLTNFNSVCP